jgi:hypothetical protein
MGITIARGLTPFHSRDNNLMRKLILASSVALLALSGAAMADQYGYGHRSQVQTGTISGQFNYSKTYSAFDKLTNTQTRNDYNGFQGFTSAEHGGKIEVKSNYHGGVTGSTVNNSTANFKGGEINGNLTGSLKIGPSTVGTLSAAGQVRGLEANSNSYSGGNLSASSQYGGSASGLTAGYAAGGAGARNETGWSQSQTADHQWGNSTTWNGAGSITAAR